MQRDVYYLDEATKITDPFYKCVCRRCRHFFWAALIDTPCPECGSGDVFRSFDKREAEEELKRPAESE